MSMSANRWASSAINRCLVHSDRFPRVKETLLLCKFCRTGKRAWVRWGNVELVDDGYLEEVHFGRDYDHVVCLNFHPVGCRAR